MAPSQLFSNHAAQAALGLPGSKADPNRFAERLRALAKTEAELQALNLEDLWLAWAALEGDPVALEELDRRLLRCVRGVTGPLPAHARTDLEQAVRQRVLVGEGKGGARLAKYAGRGALVAWLKVVATSMAIDARRREHPEREGDSDELLATASAESGADARLLDAEQKRHFNAAFKVALASLSAQQRTMLRMRFVDGLDIGEVGKAFAVHRTTAMRTLEKAQQVLMARTREELGRRLKLSESGLDNLMREMRPSLENRISRVLGSVAGRPSAIGRKSQGR